VLERLFKEVKRGTQVDAAFLNETSAQTSVIDNAEE
jgi:hypothetical protein